MPKPRKISLMIFMKNFLERKKYKILSGSVLKLIASVLMFADHAANQFPVQTAFTVFSAGSYSLTLHMLIRNISRICFPIYAFLIAEGFIHTRSREKYGWNLFFFALISEIPWNMEHTGTFFYEKQNVMFTLLFGYLGLYAIEKFKEDPLRQFISLFSLLLLSIVSNADYGVSGYGFILMLYMLRNNKILQAIIGSTVLSSRWAAGFAFIPINMYNGKRGFAGRTFFKYFFYAFYPLHLFIIYLIKVSTIGY